MPEQVSVSQLKQSLATGESLALIDVRETAEYNLAHIAGSCSLPRRRIEYGIEELVPWRGARLVVCDDDGRRAALAAATLEAIGYTNVAVLAGGLNRWVTEGGSTEWGVNVPSKDFGEKVLIQQQVPEVDPDTLHEWQQSGKDIVLLDSRTPEEHQRSCIPGSRSMPGAELGLRVWDLIDENSTVVVHCAGRTRSILGAATLQRLQVPNVYALKNGTMGWLLAGLEVETGSQRLDTPEPTADELAIAVARSRELALADGVAYVDVDEAKRILARAASETVYAIDVRTHDEFAAGHIPGLRWAPGGQLVQSTDSYIAVFDGAILLACDADNVRASMTASWLRQMGHPNVYVLDGGVSAWQAAGESLASGAYNPAHALLEAARGQVPLVQAPDAAPSGRRVLHVGTSDEFAAGHLPGATWLSRSWLELRIGDIEPSAETPILVTCRSGSDSILAAATLQDLGYRDVAALEGGTEAARRAGIALETGLTGVAQAPNDVLPVTRSYAEMLNYLRWEEELGHKYET